MDNIKEEGIYRDILDQLDKAVKDYKFPIFNNTNFPVARMRIVCFRNTDEWIILFERIAYWVSEGTFVNMISTFGNKLQNPGLHSIVEIIKETPQMPIWDDEMNFILDDHDFEVLIYEDIVKFLLQNQDYQKAGINDFPAMNKGLRLLRIIDYKLGQELFMKPAQLLQRIDHRDIPLFLIIPEWNHPDVNNTTPELPGTNECFQSLAEAIAYNDKNRYGCSKPKNSNWYYWEQLEN